MYAGPLPDTAVAASMAASRSTYRVLPAVLRRFCTVTSSIRVTSSEEVKAVIPCPIWAGRLGMARMTLCAPKPARMASIVTPAMIDKNTCCGSMLARIRVNNSCASWGFTAKITKSAMRMQSSGSE